MKDNMKIGLVCPYSMARGGGVQEIVRAMYKELTKRGHDVKIITPQPREFDGIDTEGLLFVGSGNDFRSPMGTTSQVSASIDNEAIEQMLETEQFDILHFHEPWQPFLSRQILTRSKSVNIGTFHAKIPETLMSRTIVRVVTPYTKSELKYLHELTAVSDAAAEYVGSLTDEPITIIPNGIDLKHYKKSEVERDAGGGKTILFIGRLERRKGLKYLLRAYKVLTQEQSDVSLVIAGDGPDREKMEQMVEELELPNVTFMGYVDDKTKLDLLASADLFCAPAIYGESFGIVLLEAMACGVVTVAGDNSGYSSVLKDTGAVSLVNPRHTVEFARRLQLLLEDEGIRKTWKKWAGSYVKQFSYSNIVDQYEDLYKVALTQHVEA
jgi:phosphatidylinositol alpha-mannosyltransferase